MKITATDVKKLEKTFGRLEAQADAEIGQEQKEPEKEVFDTSQFKPLSLDDLSGILDLTIKQDIQNKVICFLTMLSAYTDDAQFNLSFNAPSSTGKSYIPLEIAALFPKEDVLDIGYSSPTAFFHSHGQFVKEKQGYIVDLSRKILIFLDMPHTQLLERIRPILSHDKKEIKCQITDKSKKEGLKTKNVYLIGYPAVVFCSAGLKMDEQEKTRFLLLSPETSDEKIRHSISMKITKEADRDSFNGWVNANPDRSLLKKRIQAIKAENIQAINLEDPKKLEQLFWERNQYPKPRYQRDIGRIINLCKASGLLNLWHRKREGNTVFANEEDIHNAFQLWDMTSEAQELNIPPYLLELYQKVFVALWEANNWEGIRKKDILSKHKSVYHRILSEWNLRCEIFPALCDSGLVYSEKDPIDKRGKLYFCASQHSTSESNIA